MQRIVIATAVPIETAGLCTQWGIALPTLQQPVVKHQLSESLEAIVLVSGVGMNRMQSAISLIDANRIDCWISYGFVGGLVDTLDAYDVLMGNQVCDESGSMYEGLPHERLSIPENHLMLCSKRLLASPETKQEWHNKTGAQIVDMESLAVVSHALQRGEPFLWLRGVSDTACEPLPVQLLQCLDAAGFPSTVKAMNYLLFHPLQILQAIRLGWRSQAISKTLSVRLNEFLKEIA